VNRQLAQAGLDFRVAFAAEGYARRKWEIDMADCTFDTVLLDSRTVALGGNVERTLFGYGGLSQVLNDYRPDVVIVSGFSLATVKVWWRSLFRKTAFLIWSGSIAHPGRLDSPWRLRQRRLLAARASGGVAYGTKAKDYLAALGLPEDRIHIAINTVDTDFFRRETAALRSRQAPPQRQVLTYIGYLSPRKNVRRLLELIKQLAAERDDFELDLIGDGEDRPALEEYVRREGLSTVVNFHGYRQKEELPAFLARSRCLLFQTDFDIWGLVLAEAMAAGLACLASTNAGATQDLVREGETGFAVDFADSEQALQKMRWILNHPGSTADIGTKASAFIAEQVNMERSAAGFVEAILQLFPEERTRPAAEVFS
jgi:glycosyltransferase involved in cell wall biosynthesis